MEVSAGIAAEMALARQAMTVSVIKQAADMQEKMAEIITEAAQNVPVSETRGSAVNISV